MAAPSDAVRLFFDDYAKATALPDLTFFASAYADTFMFASPSGTQTVRLDDFLRVLPKRHELFTAAGLKSSVVESLEETVLDGHYVLVEARWSMMFVKPSERPLMIDSAATYVLRREQRSMWIVFQLDHQDLTARIRDAGLLPAAT